MTATIPPGIEDWAHLPGPAAVLDAVHTRARRGHRTETGTLTTLALTAEQRRQVALLLGTRWELTGKPVRLQDLAAKLSEHHLTVLGLVEALHGRRIEPDRAHRDRAQAEAASERERAAAHLVSAGVSASAVEQWLADPGLPRPGSGALQSLAEQVASVIARLRTTGRGTRLAQLAADTVHDAHALDADRLLGRGVARLLAIVHGLPRPQRAGRAWRAAWAGAGVVCDGVSSRVLALNLPLTGESPAARLCAAALGEPVWLTLRSLAGNWTAPAVDVFVCENPTIVEAVADALGPSCPPLVCTDGIASGAALDLLAWLTAAGCTIHARADFDPAGFTIADQVLSVAPGALSWRFDTRTYANECGLSVPHGTSGDLATAVQELRLAYDHARIPVHEERVLGLLLSDLTAETDVSD
ncbi:TIGR02679 family protein [Streptoalloteichus tenebrarius]|uniref:TIGR02679 family protein n=1 Tax=Streptoalloteichus tenebrarius (strain ATCC 17920 / DSM 40477 / JCM 4838 / CBS 697.72 / NBRC 16177 / NCIMB 11028 / NRRL B-12390 / A12253. 1 / ISP 5477) TaxID=1933 RepID=A0ABT1HNN6_STRSD|nr:DUF2399 domain-containing protein [Streptoalloteichus tenebrarius]MCP2257123.1 TIGR02679 family protein [Streptoalloteichus tenebrarius]BFE98754.1 hypothetical protein GCM10020241_04300 [Streptoalloteichus tenebrarius]